MVRLLGCLSCFLMVQAATLTAEDRFPRPEFESGYESHYTDLGHRSFDWEAVLDVGLLLLFLGLAAWLGIRKRSRRGLFVLTLGALVYFGFVRAGCICPVGSIQNVSLAIFDSVYAIPVAVLIFFLAPLLFTLISGRSFCAGVCPLGAIQEAVVIKPIQLPGWLDRTLGLIPYAYLGLAVLIVASGGGFLICQYDPFVGFFRMGAPAGMIVFGASLLAIGTVVGRPYCRFLCPYGVLLGWLSKLSWKHVQITPTACVGCTLCENSCPYGAIRKPKAAPADAAEAAQRHRKVARLLLLWPVVIAAGAGLGYAAAPILEWTRALVTDYNAEPFNMAPGGAIFGGFMGFVVMLLALREPMRKPTADYTIDPVLCVSCGRCFGDCPKESELRYEQMMARMPLPATAPPAATAAEGETTPENEESETRETASTHA